MKLDLAGVYVRSNNKLGDDVMRYILTILLLAVTAASSVAKEPPNDLEGLKKFYKHRMKVWSVRHDHERDENDNKICTVIP